MEGDLQKNGRRSLKKIEKQPEKKWKTTANTSGRQPQTKNGRRPQTQFKKSTLIGCDIIVN